MHVNYRDMVVNTDKSWLGERLQINYRGKIDSFTDTSLSVCPSVWRRLQDKISLTYGWMFEFTGSSAPQAEQNKTMATLELC